MAKIPANIIAAARAASSKWRIPASISLAQWALESGWGARSAGPHNWFGMKALTGQPSVEITTHEVYKGAAVKVKALFRAFDSDEAAFDAHGKLLATGKPYAGAREALPDPFAFAARLTGVYATDPHYGDKLAAIIRGANLTQYDA